MNTAWAFDTGLTKIGNKSSSQDTERTYKYSYSEDLDLYVTLPPLFENTSNGGRVKLDRRLVAYARLSLNELEESLLRGWDFMPRRESREWWENYKKAKAEFFTQTAPPPPPTRPPRAGLHSILLPLHADAASTAEPHGTLPC